MDNVDMDIELLLGKEQLGEEEWSSNSMRHSLLILL